MSIGVPLALVCGPLLTICGVWFSLMGAREVGEQVFHNRYMGHSKWHETNSAICVVILGVVMVGVGIGLATWGVSSL